MSLNLKGNQTALSSLNEVLQNRRFSHAYLFYGEEGTGKRTLAKQFAKGILCGSNSPPCESCASCRKIDKNIHPDLIILGGENGKNGFHAQDIRSLRSAVSVLPNESSHKVFLLQNVQDLTETAANSLLKLLEEPPSHVVFLLTCSNSKSLLPTIVSRCNPVPLFPVSENDCREVLKSRHPELKDEEISSLIWISGQAIGKALEIIESPPKSAAFKAAKGIEKGLCKGSELSSILSLAPLEEDKSFCRQSLLLFHRILCYAIRARATGSKPLPPLAEKYPLDQLLNIEAVTTQTLRANEQNANLKLLLTWYAANLNKS